MLPGRGHHASSCAEPGVIAGIEVSGAPVQLRGCVLLIRGCSAGWLRAARLFRFFVAWFLGGEIGFFKPMFDDLDGCT